MSERELRLALFLCDAGAKPVNPDDWAQADMDALVACLRRNKVPLLSARRVRPDLPIWAAPPVAEALAREQASLDRQRREYLKVCGALASLGVPCVLIKSAGIPPSFPYRSDNVDLLVPPESELAAAQALYDLGYVELRNIEEPRKFLFKRFQGSEEVSAIHLHTQVGWGTGFLVDEWLWERVRPSPDDPDVFILGPEDEVLVTLAHAFYEDKEFKIWDIVKVRHCLSDARFDWDFCARQAEERGWLHGLNVILGHVSRAEALWFADARTPNAVPNRLPPSALPPAEAETLPVRVGFAYSKRHYFVEVARDRRLSPAQKLDDAVRHALAGVRRKLRVRSQRPMLVAISGVDGSGKTAHAEALQAAFARCDLRARVVWTRGASSPLTDALIRLGKRWLGGTSAAPAGQGNSATDPWQRRAALWRRPVVRRVWPWVIALDLWRQYMARVAWPLLRGWVVIADRYVADAQAEVAAYLEAAGEGRVPPALRLLERLSPRPALWFLLDVPPDVAARRKAGQESEAFLARQAEWYRRLARAGRGRVLDAAWPLEAVAGETVRLTLLRYYRRYRTVINGLFLFNPRAKRPFLEQD
ncbi:MAG: nucleotidyltransferase family protein [Anaerolineae bacterium]